MLVVEQYYHVLLAVFTFFLVLFKTYNLPYTGPMAAQEGVILLFFAVFMQVRIKYGIGANKVSHSQRRQKAQRGWQYSCF